MTPKDLPLVGARYRLKGSKIWRTVTPQFHIANNTYNELGKAWTENVEWGLPKSNQTKSP